MREQAVSTHRLIERAVGEGRDEDAAELARYTLVEMAEPFALFPGFFDAAERFLLREGVPDTQLRTAGHDPAQPSFGESWRSYEVAVEDFAAACVAAGAGAGAGGTAAALEAYQAAVANWRQAHDDGCDRVYRYADLCARHLGEDRVEDFWDELMGGFYDTRATGSTSTGCRGATRSRSWRWTRLRRSVAISRGPGGSATSRSWRSLTGSCSVSRRVAPAAGRS